MKRGALRRYFGPLVLFAVLIGACGSDGDSDDASSTSSTVTAVEAHEIYQDAIRQCMAEKGFEYVGPPFTDRGDQATNLGYFRLSQGETLGYAGVFEALRVQTPIGEPQADLPFDQIDEYTVALRGESDPEAEPIGGCYAAADEIRDSLVVADAETESFGAFAEQILNSDLYNDYIDEWARCLAERGVTPRSSDLLRHTAMSRDHYYTEAITVIMEMSPDSSLLSELRQPPQVVDAAWLQSVTQGNDDLAAILTDELFEASIDRECRASLEALEEELIP